jgi:uncharacterized membrane protein YeiH
MERLGDWLVVFDYAAVAVFSASGALAAARGRYDIVTFGFFGAMTGIGGGTLRDLLLGAPVFWVSRPTYLLVCLAAAAAVWVFGPGRGRERVLLWLDALGVSAYAVVGALKATSLGAPPVSAAVMGVLTAAFGGIIRDVLAGEPSVLLRRELYVTPAVVGSSAFVGLHMAGVMTMLAGLAGFVLAFGVRAGAILYGWALPPFPGRPPADSG